MEEFMTINQTNGPNLNFLLSKERIWSEIEFGRRKVLRIDFST
jgi:hypothetical protein